MATQICPKCKADAFTWTIYEEDFPLTRWGCYECSYGAYEDETLECICEKCSKKKKIQLQDESSTYWWCSFCNSIT